MKLFALAKERLASVAGDTLVEAMTALLIAALGASALATMVIASANIASTNRQSLEALYQAESTLTPASAPAKPTVAISIPAEGGLTSLDSTVACDLYEGSENDSVVFVRYEAKPDAEKATS